jgi:quinoprotein glucose dehydrogenase
MALMIPPLALLISLAAAPGDGPAPAPYAPKISGPSEEAALAVQTIRLPAGFKAALFAAEPMLANPVAFAIDERGRFFVAETFRLNAGVTDTREHMGWLDDDLASRTVEDRVAMYPKHLGDVSKSFTAEHERVRLIEDLDGDGKADRSTVFADGFNQIADGIGAGLLARQGKVWFSCIPHLWLLSDTDGDGRADSRSLHQGYGVHVGYMGHDLHGLRFGPDGKLYFTIGDRGLNVKTEGRTLFLPDTGAVLRCEPDGSELEVFATGLRNPQELAFDERGDLFTCDNNSDSGDLARCVHLVEGGDSGWRIGYQFLPDRGPWNSEKLWLPRFDGQAAYLLPPVANIADGPSGLCHYPGTGLPDAYQGHFFLCDFRGVSGQSGVRSFALRSKGASYELWDSQLFAWSVLATDVDFGVDGALYLTDWVEGWDKTGKGRIYKVYDPERVRAPVVLEVKSLLAAGMAGRSLEELVKLLAHADQRIRQEAQFELAARGRPALPALRAAAARGGAPTRARLHAIWALGQIGRRDLSGLEGLPDLLTDADPEARAQAARVLGDARFAPARGRILRLLEDPSPRVQLFAALAAGKLGGPDALGPLLALLERNADEDPYLRHAAATALAWSSEPATLAAAARGAPAVVRMGILLALRRLAAGEVAGFLADPERRLVLEAARAIHDLPIEWALPQLAALPVSPATEEPLLRRILNASFRLGGPPRARAVAAAAGRSDLREETRVEALEELGDWASPSGRDRLLGLWRPIAPRPREEAAQPLRPLLPAILAEAPARVRRSAIQAAARLSIREAVPLVHDLLARKALPPEARGEAVAALDLLGDPELLQAVRIAIADPDPTVRIAGQKLLAKVRPVEAVALLERALENGATLEKQAALSTLGGMAEPGAEGVLSRCLERLGEGKVAPEIQLDLLEAAARHSSSGLREKVARYEASRPADDPMARYRETLFGGDARRGRKVFYEKDAVSCLRCHRSEGAGGEVGPNLAGVGGRQTREYLLESIVAPNRQIAKGFETVALFTRDGAVVLGVLKDEDERQVRVASPEGKLLAVPKERIRSRSAAPSAMPEELAARLTRGEMRDLVEYLASLK